MIGASERPGFTVFRTPGRGVPVRVHHTSKSLECAALTSRTVCALHVPSSAWALSMASSNRSSSLSTLAIRVCCGESTGKLAGCSGTGRTVFSSARSLNAVLSSLHFSRLAHALTLVRETPYLSPRLVIEPRPCTKSVRSLRFVSAVGRLRIILGGAGGGLSAAVIMPFPYPRLFA
jgi:hypothetical protein